MFLISVPEILNPEHQHYFESLLLTYGTWSDLNGYLSWLEMLFGLITTVTL